MISFVFPYRAKNALPPLIYASCTPHLCLIHASSTPTVSSLPFHFSIRFAPNQSGNCTDVLGSELIGYLVSKKRATSSALWRKEIFSTQAQLVAHFPERVIFSADRGCQNTGGAFTIIQCAEFKFYTA